MIWYAKQDDFQEILDAEGNRTGQFETIWPDQDHTRLYVSAAAGDAENALFGQDLRYDRVMSTSWMGCPIDEQTVLWVDADPINDQYDYVVVRKSKWKNSIVYAIRRVDIDGQKAPSSPDGEGDITGDEGPGEI